MKKRKIKGSTLLLAIVVISTVLLAGIGVGTIISRQTREMININNEAVGFYIAESIADSIDDSFVDMDDFVEWNDMTTGKEIEYKTVKEGDNYQTIIKIGDIYYKFLNPIKENIAEQRLIFRFKKVEGWGDDITFYYRPMAGGNFLSVWKSLKMNLSEYPGWWEYDLQDIYSGTEIMRVIICETSKAGSSVTDCYNNSGQHVYNFTVQEKTITLCKEKNDCINQRAFSFVADFLTSILFRFKKVEGWGDDITFYYRPMAGGNFLSVWKSLKMNLSEYPGWWEYDLQDIYSGTEIMRVIICETSKAGSSVTDCYNNSGQHVYNFTVQEKTITLCKEKNDCINQRAFSFVD